MSKWTGLLRMLLERRGAQPLEQPASVVASAIMTISHHRNGGIIKTTRRVRRSIVALVLVLGAGYTQAALNDSVTAPARDLSKAFEAVAAQVKRAVVSVYSEKMVKFRGEVIGINTAIATTSSQFAGVEFSIPVNMAKNMMPTSSKGRLSCAVSSA